MKSKSLLLIFSFVYLLQTQTFACRCRPRAFFEVYIQVDLIFKGIIVKIDTIDNYEIATFKVKSLYKGLAPDSIATIIAGTTNCDVVGSPSIGREYFLFARKYQSSYTASICDMPSDINTNKVQASLEKMALSIQKKD